MGGDVQHLCTLHIAPIREREREPQLAHSALSPSAYRCFPASAPSQTSRAPIAVQFRNICGHTYLCIVPGPTSCVFRTHVSRMLCVVCAAENVCACKNAQQQFNPHTRLRCVFFVCLCRYLRLCSIYLALSNHSYAHDTQRD